MKEILYSATLLLLIYILYVDKSLINLVIMSVSIVILIIYALRFKKNTQEHFSIISSLDTNMYNDKDFKEDMSVSMLTDLVYYISSFDKNYINFKNNILIDIIGNENGALLSGIKYNNYFQYDGVRIENPVDCPNAKTIFESFDSFSIFWYMKIITPSSYFSSENTQTFSLIKFNHDNISTSDSTFNLFDIRISFVKDHLNPMITIYIVNKEIARYTYTIQDYYDSKIFADGKHHLFTFVKDNGKLFFYVDNNRLIDCSDEQCFNVNNVTLHNDDKQISIRPDLFKINSYVDSNNNSLTLYLNAFGIYRRRVLTLDDVIFLDNYYKNIKKVLMPEIVELKSLNDRLSKDLKIYQKPCPFSNEAVCDMECAGIKDWNDIPALTENKLCFTKASDYCNGLSNLEKDRMCAYINKDNVFKMASALDPNLFMYDPNNKTNLDDKVNVDVLHKLDQLGLKNIYLDKSYRDANGKYSGEIKRLINDLTKTNQTIDIDTLSALHQSNTDTNVTNDIDYNNLVNNGAFSNDMSYNSMYNELLAAEQTNERPTIQTPNIDTEQQTETSGLSKDFIDLSYDDIKKPDVYQNLLKKHKQDKVEKEIDSWKFSNLLTGWF